MNKQLLLRLLSLINMSHSTFLIVSAVNFFWKSLPLLYIKPQTAFTVGHLFVECLHVFFGCDLHLTIKMFWLFEHRMAKNDFHRVRDAAGVEL